MNFISMFTGYRYGKMLECGSDWISFLFRQDQSVNNVKGKNQFPGELRAKKVAKISVFR